MKISLANLESTWGLQAGENYSANSKEYNRRVLKSGEKRFDS